MTAPMVGWSPFEAIKFMSGLVLLAGALWFAIAWVLVKLND